MDEGTDSVTNFSLIFINDTAGDVLTFNNPDALVDLTPFELALTIATYGVDSLFMEITYASGCTKTVAQEVVPPICCPEPSISFKLALDGFCFNDYPFRRRTRGDILEFVDLPSIKTELDLDEDTDAVTDFSLTFISYLGNVVTFNDQNDLSDNIRPFELALSLATFEVDSFLMQVEYESGCMQTVAQEFILPTCCPEPSISFTATDECFIPELNLDEGTDAVTYFSLTFFDDNAGDVLIFNNLASFLVLDSFELGQTLANFTVDSLFMEVRYASGCMKTVGQKIVLPECEINEGIESIGDFISTSVDELSDQTEGIYVYPNPAKDVVNVGIKLQEAATTEIVVTDLLGNSIKTLLNTTLVAGNHQVTWEVRDVPNGVYLINFKTNDLLKIEKIVINK